jgi:hypothetical protein
VSLDVFIGLSGDQPKKAIDLGKSVLNEGKYKGCILAETIARFENGLCVTSLADSVSKPLGAPENIPCN